MEELISKMELLIDEQGHTIANENDDVSLQNGILQGLNIALDLIENSSEDCEMY